MKLPSTQTFRFRRPLPLLLMAALALPVLSCNEIQGGDGGAPCPCLGQKGKLEVRQPSSGKCVSPFSRSVNGVPDGLVVTSCVSLPSGPSEHAYDVSSATITTTNEKLVLATYNGSCGTDCISFTWFNTTGSSDLVVTSGGVEVDRVTLQVNN